MTRKVLFVLVTVLLAGCSSVALPEQAAISTPAPQTALPAPLAPEPPARAYDLPLPLQDTVTFGHLPLESGLSQSVVSCMVQDRRGFLWLGTQDGLNRYDGRSFRIFKRNPEDPASLAGVAVSDLLVDRDGALWVSTNGGLNRYNESLESFDPFVNDPDDPASLASNNTSSLAQDASGAIWVGTAVGLDRLDLSSGKFSHYRKDPQEADSLLSDTVTTLAPTADGGLWVGTNLGLDHLDTVSGRFTHYLPDEDEDQALGGGLISSLLTDGPDTLWVGHNQGLDRLDLSTQAFQHYRNDPADPRSLGNDGVSALWRDSRGTLWVGTNGGLNRYDPAMDGFIRYQNSPGNDSSLSNDAITSIFEDNSGMLWFGTFGSGADTYDRMREKFLRVYSDPNQPGSLSSSLIWSFLRDRYGSFWVGTINGGLNRADPGSNGFRVYRHDPSDPSSMSHDQVWTVYEDRRGDLWVGSGGGLDRFDRQSDSFVHFVSVPVYALYESKDGDFWVATFSGLKLLDRETGESRDYVNNPDDPASISGNFVTAFYEEADGSLWLGTSSNGLNRYDPKTGRFTRFQNDPEVAGSLPNNIILTILVDQQDRFWVGTSAGLGLFDRRTGMVTTYDERMGLPNNTVYAILEDNQGSLWLTTNRGLTQFNPRTLAVRNYDVSDGLQSIEFNQGSAYQGRKGEMYFGGINGLNVFYPEDIRDNPFIPPMAITGFQLFYEPVRPAPDSPLQASITTTDEIRLRYDQNFFAFEYAALHFSSPLENHYAYILDGYDKDWNQVGARNLASYTGVPPGEYVFRVRGSNSDGAWNEAGASVRVIIMPPFWQTWWFIGLVALLVLGGTAGGIGLRIRSIENQRRTLARLVEERTSELSQTLEQLRRSKEAAEAANRAKSVFLTNVSHELRTPLNAIIGFSQLMIRSADTTRKARLTAEQRDNLLVIQRSGQHLLGLINDVLDMSKIEAGRATLNVQPFNLRQLLQDLESMFSVRAAEKGLSFELILGSGLPSHIRADEGKIRQVLLNLLGNAVKFTRQGGVALRAGVQEGESPLSELTAQPAVRLRFAVEDTGPGIAPGDMESIFTPFSQAEAGMESHEGTGLGLSISRQFARMMGGDLEVSSEEGRGSTFTFSLPTFPAEASEVQPGGPLKRVTSLAPGQPTWRLLVVDDSEVNRKLLVRLFEPLGFEVREAVDGKEAIEAWEAWEPHLVWMDMRMPVMDGYEATRRIKATTRGQATVIIALTASALEEERAVILSEGCNDYVRKPFREEQLFTMLGKHLGVRFIEVEVAPQAAGALSDERAELARRLAGQPEELRWELRQAAHLGYTDQLQALLQELARSDAGLANRLGEWAEAYRHEEIISLLDLAEGEP